MTKKLLLHIALFSIFLLGSIVGYSQNMDKVLWDKDLSFSWDMFKEKRTSYGYIKAMTYSGIMYEVDVENGIVNIDVQAYFIYGKSWVMKGFKKPHLLKHEKVHFDIAEIFKRKLDVLYQEYRVDYDTFIKKGYEKSLQKDFDHIFDEMDAYQEKYDKETEHGTKNTKQSEWERLIQKNLKKF